MPSQDVSIARYFADLTDPRIDRTEKHALGDILVIAMRAIIAGADSWEEVEQFGVAKRDWLRTFLTLPNGVPSHDTFYRVFARLDPDKFGACVARWTGAVCEAVVAELGACYPMGKVGLPLADTWQNSASYLQHWLKAMNADPRFIFRATAQANRAADHVLSYSRQQAPEEQPV